MWKTLLLFLVLVFPFTAYGNPCLPLTDPAKVQIIGYLSKWIGVPETAKLEIESDELVLDTCYRRLLVKGHALRPAPFFLSPDQRFLSRALLDLTVDPAEEKAQAQADVNKVLLSDPSPSRGSLTSAVTIVEFGDFECLFCKRFHEWVQSLAVERADFRLVFKHLPLQGHPWAHDASAFAVCAEMQSEDGFWRLHDFFYANQATLTSENLESRVAQGFADLTAFVVHPDGRAAVVNCEGIFKERMAGPAGNHRSCRIPLVGSIVAELHGDNAKLIWVVSLDGKKMQSETYKVLAILDKAKSDHN